MTALHAPAYPTPSPAARLEIAVRAAIEAEGLELPPLPQVAIEAANLADADAGSAAALARLIQRDLALASQVMRVANSALYARRAPIVSLHQAIAWLGVDAIRHLALAFAVRGQLFGSSAFEPQLKRLWRESVTVGCFAQEIARARRRNVETAYLCGLLHRIGLAVILCRLGRGRAAADVCSAADPRSAGNLQNEAESMLQFAGDFERRIGAELAAAWTLPAPVAATIRWFHCPAEATESKLEVAQVALARALAAGLDEAAAPTETSPLPSALLDELGLYPADIERLQQRHEQIRASVETFL